MGLKLLHELFASNDETKGATRVVLIIILLAARDDSRGDAWPSLATIAQRAGITRATAFKAVKELERLGIIVKQGRVAIRRGAGSKDRSLQQYVNQYRIPQGVFRAHTPSGGEGVFPGRHNNPFQGASVKT